MLSLNLDPKITFSLQYDQALSTIRLNLVLKSSESLPKYSKIKVNFLLRTMILRSFLINTLFKNL